jgi:hypothetical protein
MATANCRLPIQFVNYQGPFLTAVLFSSFSLPFCQTIASPFPLQRIGIEKKRNGRLFFFFDALEFELEPFHQPFFVMGSF